MNRRQLKDEAQSILNNHFKFWALLVLPFIIIEFIIKLFLRQSNNQVQFNNINDLSKVNNLYPNLSLYPILLVFIIISAILTISISFASLNAIRGKNDYKSPFNQSTLLISKGRYFWGSFLIGILKYIFLMLWSLLFIIIVIAVGMLPIESGDKISIDIVVIIAGFIVLIIKSLSYYLAYLIYYDDLRNNQNPGFLKSISKSRELLKNHLGEFFILILSFIGWYILGYITFGIAYIWILPYYDLTIANYYDHLVNNQK